MLFPSLLASNKYKQYLAIDPGNHRYDWFQVTFANDCFKNVQKSFQGGILRL